MCPLRLRTKFSEEQNYYNLDNMILLSCTTLQNLFRTYWLKWAGEDWINCEENGEKLFELSVRHINARSKKMLKKVKKGCVEEWDIPTFSLLLPAFGDATTDEKEAENKNIKTLKEIRNFVKHHKTKKLNSAEYMSNMNKIRHSLETLHVESKSIDQMMEQAVVKSEEDAKKKVVRLFKDAEACIKNGDTDKAEACLTDAVNTPSLPRDALAEAYEKRAEFYIQNCKEKLEESFLDASTALQLNVSSWKAYFLIAQYFRRKQQFPEAIENLQRGLSLSPVQDAMWQELDECRVMGLERDCVDFIQQKYLPANLAECVKQVEDGTGIPISESQYLFYNENITELFSKGQTHVFKGRKYHSGWKVQKNLVKACEHYKKAANLNNPEGIYYLALCTNRGQGVTQNVAESLQLHRKSAELNADTPGELTGRGKNQGVAFSQHSVGLAYEFGYVVPQDYKEAARWYQKSAKNGAGNACNDLGHFYMEGLGVPKNRRMGEYYLKESLILDHASATDELIRYYIEELEPERALSTFQIAQEMNGPVLPNVTKETIDKELGQVKRLREKYEAALTKFEAINRIQKKGFTFRERLIRMNPSNPYFRRLENPQQREEQEDVFCSNFFKNVDNEWCSKRTETVSNVLKLLENCEKISKLLQPSEPFYLDADAEQIVQLVYSCITIPFDQLLLSSEEELKLKYVTRQLFKTRSTSLGHDDERLRLIYAVYNLKMIPKTTADLFGEILLREGHRRYPQNHYYHYYLTKLCNEKTLYDDALKIVNEGILIAPLDLNLLYEKAVCLKNKMSNQAVAVFKQFLKLAPKDHRCFPEAHFAISEHYISQRIFFKDFKTEVDEQIKGLIDKYYYLGELAAKERHPFFKITEHNSQINVELYIFNDKREHHSHPGWFETLGVLERKPYLASPTRKALVLEQRNDLLPQNERTTKVHLHNPTVPLKLHQAPPDRFSALKPINIYEINPTAMDKIYQDTIMDLTIIEEPVFFPSSIHLKAEDDNGDVTRLYIYNISQNEKARAKFGLGCKIAIMNPYMCRDRERLLSFNHGIRVDDRRCIIYLGKIENMCRFCGEADATFNCPECRIAKYCSDECQKLDWDESKHGSICKYLKM